VKALRDDGVVALLPQRHDDQLADPSGWQDVDEVGPLGVADEHPAAARRPRRGRRGRRRSTRATISAFGSSGPAGNALAENRSAAVGPVTAISIA